MMGLFGRKNNVGKEITLKVAGMHCAACAMVIDGALEDSDGVIESRVHYAKGEVCVRFDPQRINEDKIQEIIKSEGYDIEA